MPKGGVIKRQGVGKKGWTNVVMDTAKIRQRGFSLVELMITLAVMAILAGLAAPSFASFLRSNRVSSISMEMSAGIMMARSEAVKRGTRVTICKSGDTQNGAPTCSTNAAISWATGWLIFADGGTAGTVDGTDARIKVVQPGALAAVTPSSGDFSDFFSFDSRGALEPKATASSLTLTVCLEHIKRDIQVLPTGRVNTEAGTC